MKTRIEQLWDEQLQDSRKKPIENGGVRLTRIDPTSVFDIYAGIDDSPLVVLAIGIQLRPPAILLESASLDYFRKQRADGSWLMVLRLKRRGLEQVFGRLCQDLADAASTVVTESSLVGLFRDRLTLWMRLFQLSDDGLLPGHQIKGLIAELLMLEQIVVSGSHNVSEAVMGWTGPLKADQDFTYGDRAIEVKALSPGKTSVMISSLAQLDCALPLSLVVFTLRKAMSDEFSALTLNALVTRVEGRVAASGAALTTFRDRLLTAGYIEHERYDQDWYVVVRQASYEVAASFPKLTRDSVPEGVESATYSLLLSRLGNYVFEDLVA